MIVLEYRRSLYPIMLFDDESEVDIKAKFTFLCLVREHIVARPQVFQIVVLIHPSTIIVGSNYCR